MTKTQPYFKYNRRGVSKETLLEIYRNILLPRMIEEKMILLLRQNRISKWFSGIGQEGISIGAAMAMGDDEFILPMHRNLGIFTTRKLPLNKLFAQFQGKEIGYTKGRDRSFHFGSVEDNIIGMISHLGPQLSLADGIALASKMKGEQKATLVFTGDGGTSEGEFHEAVNLAAVWNLPVIFLIENNGYGLSTPNSQQFAMDSFVDKAPGYGIKAKKIEGNNVVEVYKTIDKVAKEIRKDPKPYLIECTTFRMRGHEESSGTKYIPDELFKEWGKKDPVLNFERYLLNESFLNTKTKKKIKEEISEQIDKAVEEAFGLPDIGANTESELADVYKPHKTEVITPKTDKKSEKRFIEAISEGLYQSMERDDNVFIMGQDIAEYGGVFKVTSGFLDKFGEERVRNTPITESAVIGAALGSSVKGFKPIVEMQFADFVTCGFNQIVNNLAKLHYRWGQNSDVVVRMPTGAGVGAGPFHSQSNEGWFFHVPGLKIVYPSNPYDAKGLLAASIQEPNPVLFFEHKALYRRLKEEVPDDYYTLELGKAKLVNEGDKLTVITYGYGVIWAQEAIEELNISADIIDLRTLLPYDKETVYNSIEKTGKVIILHEDTKTGGIGAEISADITENLFERLDGPIMRVASLDTPVPFADALEKNFLPAQRFKEAVSKLLKY